jgi:hypothetical protein
MTQNVEQADGKSIRHGGFHYWLKRWKARKERRAAKKNPETNPTYNKYKGYEL